MLRRKNHGNQEGFLKVTIIQVTPEGFLTLTITEAILQVTPRGVSTC